MTAPKTPITTSISFAFGPDDDVESMPPAQRKIREMVMNGEHEKVAEIMQKAIEHGLVTFPTKKNRLPKPGFLIRNN